MSKSCLALTEIASLNLTPSSINSFHIDFNRRVIFDIWMPGDIKPFAKRVLLTFESLESIRINIERTVGVEFTQPITVAKYSEDKHGKIMGNNDDPERLNHYTLTMDEGVIEIIAGYVTLEVIAE